MITALSQNRETPFMLIGDDLARSKNTRLTDIMIRMLTQEEKKYLAVGSEDPAAHALPGSPAAGIPSRPAQNPKAPRLPSR